MSKRAPERGTNNVTESITLICAHELHMYDARSALSLSLPLSLTSLLSLGARWAGVRSVSCYRALLEAGWLAVHCQAVCLLLVLVFSVSRFRRVYALRKSEQTPPTLSCTARVVAAVIIIIVAVAVTLAVAAAFAIIFAASFICVSEPVTTKKKKKKNSNNK